jgi:hypothetical protein
MSVLSQPLSRPSSPNPAVDHPRGAPAGGDDGACPRPVLVVVATQADTTGVLADAAGRARVTGRPLVVAMVVPAPAFSTDPVVQAVMAQRRAASYARLIGSIRETCEQHGLGTARIVELRARRRALRRSRLRLLRRDLTALARRHGADLHPLPASVLGRDRG